METELVYCWLKRNHQPEKKSEKEGFVLKVFLF